MNVDLKGFLTLTLIIALSILILFFAPYPLKDWFPFATLIFPKFQEYSLIFLLNQFVWVFIVAGMLAVGIYVAKEYRL